MIGDCLNRLVAAKRISRATADAALALHQGAQQRLIGSGLAPAQAAAAAALQTAKAMAATAQARKLRIAMTAIRQADLEARMAAHPRGGTAGLLSALTTDPWGAGRGLNVESHSQTVEGFLFKRVGAALDPYRSRFAGLRRDVEGPRNVVRELFDEDTGDAGAKAAAAGWKAAVEAGVTRIKAAGLPLRELDTWRLPQFWERSRIMKFRGDFLTDVLDAVDSGGLTVIDKATDLPADRLKVPAIVQAMQEDVIAGRGGTGAGGGFDPRTRIYRFNTAETWLRFADKYGAGRRGVYPMMLDHVRGMAREIALAEVLGPEHRATVEALVERARRSERLGGEAVAKLHPARLTASPTVALRTYQALSGEASAPVNEALAGLFGAVRSIKSAASLGSAIVAAIPGDSFTMGWAAAADGLPVLRVLRRALTLMVSDSKNKRAIAAQLNVVAHGLADTLGNSARFEDQIVGRNVPSWLAGFVMRASGLAPWTNAAKRVVAMEFLGAIAREGAQPFDRVDPAFGRFLRRYGFTPAEWDQIRSVPPIEVEGARFADIEGLGKLGDRLMSAIIDERHQFVIEPTALTQAITRAGTRPGTILGEGVRSAWLWKNFAVSILMGPVMRAMTEGSIGARAWRTAGFIGGLTLAGAVALQAKSILAGKDPADMTSADFWGRAFATGGGAGIYGDFILGAVNNGGQSIASTVAGPVLGEIGGTFDLIATGIRDLAVGPRKNGRSFGQALAQYVRRWMPGSTMWFTRIATDRLLYDWVQTLADPNAGAAFARQRRRVERESGQRFWWAPGEPAPSRAPDFRSVLP